MASKVGTLIKEARTAAGLTQEALARQVADCSASDISKAERGEKELTQTQLKAIAKATGVTQKSLLDAAKGTTNAKATSGKTSTAKRSSAKSPSAKTSTARTTGSTSGQSSVKVTAAEKKLLELYRAANSDTKKAAVALLKGEKLDTDSDKTVLDGLLNTAIDMLTSFGK